MDEMLKLTHGTKGTPVLHIGDHVIQGFHPDQIDKALEDG